MSEYESACACEEEYDSETGEFHEVTCDWCIYDGCKCEYSYDRDGRYLDYECDKCASSTVASSVASTVASSVASSVAQDPWATEKATITQLLYEIQWAYRAKDRLTVVERLFRYVQTVKPFLVAFPQMRTVLTAKVAEIKDSPQAAPILDVLIATEAFLAAVTG